VQPQAEVLQFGRFRLEPRRRLLLADGVPVTLSSRAYDILELLVRCHDRILSRDEIVAHVWQGMVVGENNLAVQMSALRRALGEHADGAQLIVNLPGRGYRFVADVTLPPQVPTVAEPPATTTEAKDASPSPARPRRIGWIAGGAGILIAALLVVAVEPDASRHWVSEASSAAMPEARLSIAVPRFAAIGDDHRTAAVALRYTDAVLARFGQFEDLVLYSDPEAARSRFTPHFRLTGTVEIIGANAILTVGLTDMLDGRLLYRDSRSAPAATSGVEQSETALQVLVAIRPILFQAEAARRKGLPRDGLDFVIAAQEALGYANQLAQLRQARLLAEEAVRRDPASRAARSLLAVLLTDDMLFSSAKDGDEKGRRALAIMDGILREQPRNSLYIYRRAHILAALGRLDDAQATAELGLQIEPGYRLLTEKLGEIAMMKGDLAAARTLMQPDPNDTQDDTLATIAFAEERYVNALALVRPVVAATPDGCYTSFNVLLEVATLSRLGRAQEARATLNAAISELSPDLRSVGAQRQTTYVLPDRAWQQFKQGLAEAGLPP